MTKKRTENQQSLNVADSLLDGWLNSFKTLQGFQTEIDEKSLKAIDNQKEILNSTRGILSKIEEEANKKTEELKESLQNTIKTMEKDQVGSTVSTWMSQIEEVNNSILALSWTPSKIMLDLFSQSQDHLESNVKEALEQQQQARSEALKTIEKLTEQIKKTHKELLPSI
jgi:putative cell wall-binding protein